MCNSHCNSCHIALLMQHKSKRNAGFSQVEHLFFKPMNIQSQSTAKTLENQNGIFSIVP